VDGVRELFNTPYISAEYKTYETRIVECGACIEAPTALCPHLTRKQLISHICITLTHHIPRTIRSAKATTPAHGRP